MNVVERPIPKIAIFFLLSIAFWCGYGTSSFARAQVMSYAWGEQGFVSSTPVVVPVLVAPPLTPSAASLPEVIPNDPYWDRQWYLRQIGASAAWKVATGTRQVVVAVIDGGVDINHPDLRDNIWRNPFEVDGDGIDNDENGFVDDIHGWNFIRKNADVRPVFQAAQSDDAWSHGTMVASLLGAKGDDGLGMAGVAWNVQIMPLVALDAHGSGVTRNIVASIHYAVTMGAEIINLSLAGYDRDPVLEGVIQQAAEAGVLIVAAVGNDEARQGMNIDQMPVYPACQDVDEDAVIGVGGTDRLDEHAPYTNYGRSCTDISAPAFDLFVARPSYAHDPYGSPGSVPLYRSGVLGTSLAAPLVSGAAALLKSVHPDWTAVRIRDRLYETVDTLSSSELVNGKGVGGYGRLNVGRALEPLPAPVIPVSSCSMADANCPLL